MCYQQTRLSFDDCEDMCTSFYYHNQAENMIHCLGSGHETVVYTVCLLYF